MRTFALPLMAAALLGGCVSHQPPPPVPVAAPAPGPITFEQWRRERIASLAAMDPTDVRLAPGIREVATRAIQDRYQQPRTPAERQRAMQVETAIVQQDVVRAGGRGGPARTSGPATESQPRVPSYQGNCTPTTPCVGPRGGLYYITASGNRVYLSRRR
ncbi:hypothetical protein KPL78_07215 [Roseomonas sp. HJA6]|uniref:Lipoprotein n=1 Tax=Roseomonas alba TaxID=2846776 RepID=A0ABS7A5P1_9PROT|nr:hypothetical protein [Neoroseomonas alba]MBW6397627.1 hypothetical protein [Neoroseomonas alba]